MSGHVSNLHPPYLLTPPGGSRWAEWAVTTCPRSRGVAADHDPVGGGAWSWCSVDCTFQVDPVPTVLGAHLGSRVSFGLLQRWPECPGPWGRSEELSRVHSTPVGRRGTPWAPAPSI